MDCEGVLLAKTVPEQTKDGDVTICSAWYIPDLGGLTRVYPLPRWPSLPVWTRYRLHLTKSDKDSRFRSYKLKDGSIPTALSSDGREAMRPYLTQLADRKETIRSLNSKRDSMGIIRPLSIEGSWERGAPDITRQFGRKTFDLRPRICFEDQDGSHSLGLNEWGCYEWLRKGKKPDQLWANLRLSYSDREQLLLVGNLRDHPTAWVVIAVIGYGAIQASLFRHVPEPIRREVFERDNFRCQNPAGCDRPNECLTIDHIVPLTRGGDSSRENLRVLCLACQLQKNDRLDSEWLSSAEELVLL